VAQNFSRGLRIGYFSGLFPVLKVLLILAN